MYIKNERIYTREEIIKNNPEISFPTKNFDSAVFSLGYELIIDNIPQYDSNYQYLNPIGIVQNEQIYEVLNIPLADFKVQKLEKINSAFLHFFQDGCIESSLGFTADCRRCNDKNDLQNIQGLIDLYAQPVPFKSKDGSIHMLTLEQLEILKTEMIQRVQQVYANKWTLEASVEASETIEEIEAVDVKI